MKKLFTTVLAFMAAVCVMAQGWPENYGGVMLQGFYWDYYDDTDWGTWSALEGQADDLEGYIDLIWVPNSGQVKTDQWNIPGHNRDMGYMPMYWLQHNSCFGTQSDLTKMISTYKAKGIGIIEDVVINHKNGMTNWCDFPNEEVTGTYGTYKLDWTLADICYNDNGGACINEGYDVTGAADTGDDFDGCRDLDHTGANVQKNVKTYLDYLQKELGYSGFRYDMVKGYGAQYVGIYNEYANPTFSVGEYWDDWNGVTNWINGTKRNNVVQSAAFDFPLKFLINQAFTGSFDGTKLETQGMAGDNFYKRYSVTFVDNHDTYRDGNCMSNTNHVLAANAFILAMPGTPCIFLPHWKIYKKSLKKMIAARKAAGITNQSSFTKMNMEGGIGFVVSGTKGSVLVTLGYVTAGIPEGYKIVVSGDAVNNDFCFYVNNDLEVPVIEDEEENTIQNDIRVYLAQTDNVKNFSLHVWNSNGNLTGDWYSESQKIGNLISNDNAGTAYVKNQAWYYVTFPNQEVINLVLHNGDTKTVDVNGITSDIFLSYTGGTDYDNLTSNYAGYPQAWYEQGEICAFFVDDSNQEWGNIHAWAWKDNTNYTGGSWPGEKCEELGYNESGKKIYKWTYTGDLTSVPDKIVFNKGNDEKQTADCEFKNGAWYNASNTGSNTSPISTDVAPCTEITLAALGNPTFVTNWNGLQENVAEMPNDGSETISKSFTLTGGSYIVQAIVRGTNGSNVELSAGGQSTSVNLTGFNGAPSTVQTNGVVEVYEPGTNNGWQKVELAFTLSSDEKVTVTLTSAAESWQLGALKVLSGTTKTKAAAGTFIDETGKSDFSFYERGQNRNALIKAESGTLPALLPYNVIVGTTCANLMLTDGDYSFGNTGDAFTATAASYDRTFTVGQRSTVYLPFALDAGEVTAAGKFWALDSYDGEVIHFKEVVTTEANTPYIFEAKTSQPFIILSPKAVPTSSLNPVEVNGISFVGVNERTNLKSVTNGTTYYGYKNNEFVKVGTDVGANLNPFRAYLMTGSSMGARMSVLFDDEEGGMTGIQDVTPAVEPVRQQPIFNLSGQRVLTPNKKGLYIIGGKKYLVK